MTHMTRARCFRKSLSSFHSYFRQKTF